MRHLHSYMHLRMSCAASPIILIRAGSAARMMQLIRERLGSTFGEVTVVHCVSAITRLTHRFQKEVQEDSR